VYFTSGTHTSRPAQFPSEIPQSYKALADVLEQDRVRAAEAAAKAAAGGGAPGATGTQAEPAPPKREGGPGSGGTDGGGDGSR